MSVILEAKCNLPTKEYGTFEERVYSVNGDKYIVAIKGDINKRTPLVRIQSQCLEGEVFNSLRCDCKEQLDKSLELIAKEDNGVLIYAPQEQGRGLGITKKIQALHLEEGGIDTFSADKLLGVNTEQRKFNNYATLLEYLGLKDIALLTNNPNKEETLESSGINCVRLPLTISINELNEQYIKSLYTKGGHYLPDEVYMKQAIAIARLGEKQTGHKPMVGALLVKYGKIIGSGYYIQEGVKHAEVHAIEKAGDNTKGSTLYATLEPCSHYGTNPPCSKAVINAGIERALISMQDPNPKVDGQGIKELGEHGIYVSVGILKKEALELNKEWIEKISKGG